jgi:RNA polymerase sigma factor (sigma-70 family)
MARRRKSDAALLRASRTDPEAFGVFYARHLPLVLGFLVSRSNDRELAADLAAEVFAAALEGRDRFDERRGSASTWLCTIASYKLIDTFRRRRVEAVARARIGLPVIELNDDDLDRVVELAADAREVARLVAELPADVQQALAARVIDERDYVDIASELQCSEAVIRKRVSRGLASLRAKIQESQ